MSYRLFKGYQRSVITKSSPWQHKRGLGLPGFPLQAIAGSLILHALVLAALAPPFVTSSASFTRVPAPSVLLGVLLPIPPAAPPLPLQRPGVSVAPVLSRRVRQPAALPAVVSHETSVARAGDHAGVGAPPIKAGVNADASADSATTALVEASDAGGADAAGLRQFRLTLAGEARQFRRYPEAARRAGLSGTAEVRISVAVGGLLRHAELSRSSGHALLDAAALDMLQQAATHAVLPESLRGRRFTVLLPVQFVVDE